MTPFYTIISNIYCNFKDNYTVIHYWKNYISGNTYEWKKNTDKTHHRAASPDKGAAWFLWYADCR